MQIPAIVYAHGRGHSLTNEANLQHLMSLARGGLDPGFAVVLLLVLFSFGPSLAGVIVTALFHGRAGLQDLARRAVKVRVPARWVLIVLLVPVGLCAGSLLAGWVLGGFAPYRFDLLMPLAWFVPLLMFMLVFTGVAEELGWRGYALPQLQRRNTAERASWILGVLWGLWHLPANLLGPYLRGQLSVPMVVAVLLGLTVGIVGWTIVLTWIYNNTGSLFWIIVLHGWANTVQSYLVLSSGSFTAQVAYGVLPWVIAVVVLKRYGPATLTGADRDITQLVASATPDHNEGTGSVAH
ncbi:CPBP family intramembrane glutamic endopeptidase [Kocuria flava]|uniref:CPBP family intramembrane glutamic endopeptidase n=1 Tax=Kocuria flava TaxID=446860 RepID=UPI002150D867|nr:CPBP family intramembrane glutamic endopeptidase [Kocuria flava]